MTTTPPNRLLRPGEAEAILARNKAETEKAVARVRRIRANKARKAAAKSLA